MESQLAEKDSVLDQEILERIQKEYFDVTGTFDPSRFELSKVPEVINSNDVIRHYKRLQQEHYIVSRRVLFLILQKQVKCSKEVHNLVDIQKHLTETSKKCKMSRTDLHLVMCHVTFSSFQILYYCRKRKTLGSLLQILQRMKTLYHTKNKLQQLLQEENYPKVIPLISECQKATKTYIRFRSIVELCNQLSDVLEQVEENLDLLLSRICYNFDEDNYASILLAYNLLSKSEFALEQLHMHFVAAVQKTALLSISKYAKSNMTDQYNDLCKTVPSDSFFICLIDLCRSLLVILKSYDFIREWHDKKNKNDVNQVSLDTQNQQYDLKKLQDNIRKISNDIENKIVIYIDASEMMHLKFEEFIRILRVVDKMNKIGLMICQKNLVKLHECIRKKFMKYFTSYHASRLDELRIFLEHDGWESCPLKSSFEITQLTEFKDLKSILNPSQNYKNIQENSSSIENRDDYINQVTFDDLMSYFDDSLDEYVEEDILRTSKNNEQENPSEISDDDDDDEITEELIQNHGHRRKAKKISGPIMTNVTLSLLRVCGKYLQVTQFFQEEIATVAQCMVQIFEYYFFTVYSLFTSDLDPVFESIAVYNSSLKRILSRIKDTIIIDINNDMESNHQNHKVGIPQLSSMINLKDPEYLFGLMNRIVAIESLILLGQQYENFRTYLNSLVLDEQNKNYLNQFYQQTIPSISALRKPIFIAVIQKAFNINNVLLSMDKVNWDIEEISCQHSAYIDFLIEETRNFKTKLNFIQNNIPLSKEVLQIIWENVAHIITHTLVEGFSNVKKCSNAGRALMQLDFTQYVSIFETISSLKPMPHQDYVAVYIKAYYMTDSSVESWIKTHPEYSVKLQLGLVTCMQLDKIAKQRLLNIIEDQRSR